MNWIVALLLASSACAFDSAPVGGVDAGYAPTIDAPVAAAPRCQLSGATISCPAMRRSIGGRTVLYQLPSGAAPPGGWPAVVMFHGALASVDSAWESTLNEIGGGWHETQTVSRLLDSGFAVLTPAAEDGAWQTNTLWDWAWSDSPDHQFLMQLFAAMATTEFGSLSSDWCAVGFSSGGFMTSRMALSYANRFRRLAIHSAGWAQCAGAVCALPDMPTNHPPTLFLHGNNDLVVPDINARTYLARLRQRQIEARGHFVDGGHTWLAAAPDEIVAWFQ